MKPTAFLLAAALAAVPALTAAPLPAAAEAALPGFAVGVLRQVRMGPEIRRYLEEIDATLEPYGGTFLIHGGPVERLEGDWRGDLIVIRFPTMAQARDWYGSDAYRRILPLRTGHAEGEVVLIEGVGADHAATDVLRR